MTDQDSSNDLDFDMASRKWRENKVYLGKGVFAYRCSYIHSNGKHCSKVVSAQKQTPLYRIREDWITPKNNYSSEYCKKHAIRGSRQINLLGE
jgi:hypothetical protein